MNYLFFGDNKDRIDIYISSFINKIFADEDKNAFFFNENSKLEDIVAEIEQFDFINPKKAIIFYNFNLLKISKNDSSNRTLDEFLRILENNNNSEDLYIILVDYESTIDNNNKFIKHIPSENRKLLLDLKENEWPLYIKKYFNKKSLEIDEDAVEEIIKRTNFNLKIFINEAEKLIIYCDKKISLDDVKNIVINEPVDDIFKLSKVLLNGNKEEAISIFRDLRLTQNIEPVTLIGLLSSSLILIDEILYLKKCGDNDDEIASKLKIKKGKIYYLMKDSKNIKALTIKKAISELHSLDKQIKHSEVDRYYAFELFILNFNEQKSC